MDNQHLILSLCSVITGFAVSFCKRYGVLSLLVCSVVVLDVFTGIFKAKISRYVNSNAGYKGFWKKLSLFAGLFFGYFLDFFELYLLSVGNLLSFSFQIPFGTIIGVYIILNESISVFENLYACGVKLPIWICKALKIANKQLKDEKSKK